MKDWQHVIAGRFTATELATIAEFLNASTELGARHAERVRGSG